MADDPNRTTAEGFGIKSACGRFAPALSCALLLLLGLASVPLVGQKNDAPVITMERTGCPLGTCPVYSLRIYADGRVAYEGKQFVAVEGRQVIYIPVDEVQRLVREFLQAGYLTFQESYTILIDKQGRTWAASDLPTTYTSLTVHGQTKRVENYFGAPPELHRLEEEVDRTVNFHQWWHGVHDLRDWDLVSADVYSEIKPGLTKLMRAAVEWDTKALRTEIRMGGDVNATDETRWTAVMYAAGKCRPKSVKLLIDSGANPKAEDQNGDTALVAVASAFCYHEEERQGRKEIMRMLVQAGVDPNRRNKKGQTPLMAAAQSGSPESVLRLLSLGASAELKDSQGKMALDYAKQALPRLEHTSLKEGSVEVVRILSDARPRP